MTNLKNVLIDDLLKDLKEEGLKNPYRIFPLHRGSKIAKHKGIEYRYCNSCNFIRTDRAGIVYSDLCLGEKEYSFLFFKFGKLLCPTTIHYHVSCTVCGFNWIEDQY